MLEDAGINNCHVGSSMDDVQRALESGAGIGIDMTPKSKKPWKAQIVDTVWKDVIVFGDTKEEAEAALERGDYEEEEVVKEEYDQTTWGPEEVKDEGIPEAGVQMDPHKE